MSDPRAKAERSKAKDIRQGIAAQPEREQKVRRYEPKPWVVLWSIWGRKEMVWGRYKTEEIANEVIRRKSAIFNMRVSRAL